MRVGIFGAGCVGIFVGAHIQSSNKHEVHYVGRSVLRRVEKAGELRITDFKRPSYNLRYELKDINVHYDERILKTCDVIFVCLKLGQNNKLLEGLNQNTTVVFLQNGVRKPENVGKKNTVVQGMIPYGVNELKPGHFHRCTAGSLAFENTLPDQIVSALRNSGLGVKLYERSDFEAVKWFKLIVNLGNALNAVCGKPLATCLRNREYRTMLRTVWKEGLEVCEQANIPLMGDINGRSISFVMKVLALPNFAYNTIAKIMKTTDENYKSSMLTDLILKRQTELEELNFRIVMIGKKYGVPTPVNELLVRLVKKAESQNSGSPSKTPSELYTLAFLETPQHLSSFYYLIFGMLLLITFISYQLIYLRV